MIIKIIKIKNNYILTKEKKKIFSILIWEIQDIKI